MTDELIKEAFSLFSAEEREVLMDNLAEKNWPLIKALALARRRAYLKACSDAETDVRRRLTCGARLPRETVERYRECARSHGLSLYQFSSQALEREYVRLTD